MLGLLLVAAAPLLAQSLLDNPTPRPVDAFWQPMRLPTCERSGPPGAAIEFGGSLWFAGGFESFGRSYVGGAFRWDGAGITGVGRHDFPARNSLVEWNGALYASGGIGAGVQPRVFRWNGAAWDTVASSDGGVNAMCVYQGSLFVVGGFKVIGGVQAFNAATFDGTSWHALTAPPPANTFSTSGLFLQIVAIGANVYSSGLQRFDGSAWTSISSGLNGGVNGIATDGIDLYASGQFTTSAVDSCPSIARWDGTAWRRTGPPPPRTPGGAYAEAIRIAFWNGQLYTSFIDGTGRIWSNQGAQWQPVSPTFGVNPSFIVSAGSKLVVLSRFRPPFGGAPGSKSDIKLYDGTNWSDVLDTPGPDMVGTDFYTSAGLVLGDRLYATGSNLDSYNGAVAIRTNNLASWNGTQWSAVGSGLFSQPLTLGNYGSDLVVGGSFFNPAGGRNIASWNGAAWTSYGSGLSYYVLAAHEHLGEKYAGYDFGVHRYTGTGWTPVGGGAGIAMQCRALSSWSGQLIAAGDFTSTTNGVPLGRIAAWNGTVWSPLGGGLNETCYALTTDGPDLVVGGEFTSAGGLPIEGVARWDGTQWRAMGSRARVIIGFTHIGDVLYALGVFRQPDDELTCTVASWNGEDWTTLGSGTVFDEALPFSSDLLAPTRVQWLAGYHGDLYVGGAFGYAFGQATSAIIRLPAANTLAVGEAHSSSAIALSASPNPARSSTRLSFALSRAGSARLTIHDVQGREISRLLDGPLTAGVHEAIWSPNAAPGLYFARLSTAHGNSTTRLVRVN